MKDDPIVREITDSVLDRIKSEQMTLQLALAIIRRGEELAASLGVPMVFTVVDEGGNMVAMHRMDHSLLASIAVSGSKAYTAVALQCPTDEAAQTILPGQSLYGLQQTHPGRFCLFGGGVPIIRGGRCVGGLGASGGTVEQDTAAARHAVSL